MRNPFKSGTPEAFFWRQAGWSYKPGDETPAQGRHRCALSLARAERKGSDAGLSFAWAIDPDSDSSSFSDEEPTWCLWSCCCRGEGSEVLASLHGIDFGRDKEPWGDPYRRVVEAELASEALDRIPS